MSPLQWKAGNRHCPGCGEWQQLRLWGWWGWSRWPLPTWRCSGCNALLGYDSRRWFAWAASLVAGFILLAIVHFVDEWLFWATVVTFSGFEVLCLRWSVSVVLKEQQGRKA